MREISEEERKIFINKRIKDIYVDGFCVEIVLENNIKLFYDASDGGYSTYSIEREEENE